VPSVGFHVSLTGPRKEPRTRLWGKRLMRWIVGSSTLFTERACDLKTFADWWQFVAGSFLAGEIAA
jgi:hypothetical protein